MILRYVLIFTILLCGCTSKVEETKPLSYWSSNKAERAQKVKECTQQQDRSANCLNAIKSANASPGTVVY